jgi:tetratricopeptide (TPR) repeat protein
VEEINTRLDQRFRPLTGGDRAAMPRQQTLRALINWSYDLLNAREKLLLCRLCVFSGGWTLTAAEAVCVGESASGESLEEWEVLDLLTSLSDKSLVVSEDRSGSAGYRFLESMRQYGLERLADSGESESVRDRHLDYFISLVEEAEPHLLGAKPGERLALLEAEHENLRSALYWSMGAQHTEECLRLCGAVWWFWFSRGYPSEGREWCLRALGMAGAEERTAERAKVLHGLGGLAYTQGDFGSAQAFFEESLTIFREIGDRKEIANLLSGLGFVSTAQGDYGSALAYQEESLPTRREIGDQRGLGYSLNCLGLVSTAQGDYGSARDYLEESLTIRREIGDRRGIGYSHFGLGLMSTAQADYSSARAYQEESLTIQRDIGDRFGISGSLTNLGFVSTAQGDFGFSRALLEESLTLQREMGDLFGISYSLEAFARLAAKNSSSKQAAVLWGAAEALREQIGAPSPPYHRELYLQEVAQAREALGEEAFSSAWSVGMAMRLEEAMEHAVTLSVPLDVQIGLGLSWKEAGH